MTGLKQRILGRRNASPTAPEGPSAPDPQDATAGVDAPAAQAPAPEAVAPADLPSEQPTDVHTAESQTTDAPAGAEPVVSERPGFRERGQMRRRLRYLRRAHELGLRDLGGLVFDLRRFRRQRFDLVEAKLQTLGLVDREMRALEAALDDGRPVVELREAGISSCPRCGGLTASDANFCSNCGLQIGEAPPILSAPNAPTAPAVATAPDAPSAPAPPALSVADAGSEPISATPPANGTSAEPAAPAPSAATTSGDPLAPPRDAQ
ncbi:MAG: zinc ribbon domain-containing protein [Solirubrobacteraceae bacterium]|nr:zinc ribbon domain-containing protein [Solirubrobacteraceae bacterium]